MDETISIVLFSGTDDKLTAAATLAAGAAALGRPVKIFLQYWALDAFRADRIKADHGLAPEAGEAGKAAVDAAAKAGQAHWLETPFSDHVNEQPIAAEGGRLLDNAFESDAGPRTGAIPG
jgi:peroxiredoxin family protein